MKINIINRNDCRVQDLVCKMQNGAYKVHDVESTTSRIALIRGWM